MEGEEPHRLPSRERPYVVYFERPRCPVCHSSRLRAHRTSRHGDESLTRHSVCQDCGQRVHIVVE